MSMLTVNEDGHDVMKHFHAPDSEKRMIVALRPGQYEDWLHASTVEAVSMLNRYPAEELLAAPTPKPPRLDAGQRQRMLV